MKTQLKSIPDIERIRNLCWLPTMSPISSPSPYHQETPRLRVLQNMDYIWTSMIMMKPRYIPVHYTSFPQPMETPTRHSFEQVTTREGPLRKFSWHKLKTAGIFLFNRNTTPTPSTQPRPRVPTSPYPRIQPASTVRSQKCRKGSRRDLGFEPSLQEERFPNTSPARGEKPQAGVIPLEL